MKLLLVFPHHGAKVYYIVAMISSSYYFKGISQKDLLIDFSSFDKILVHLKLQTCFVLPGLISTIQSFQKISLEYEDFSTKIIIHIYIFQSKFYENITIIILIVSILG